MLECNFNELDNDFITIWSRYLLSHDETQIALDLEKLAELGQINAIQSYYLLMCQSGITEMNNIIDNRVDENFYSKNFNHILAAANRICATDLKERSLLIDLINTYNKEHEEYEDLIEKIEFYSSPWGDADYPLIKNHMATFNKIKNTKFCTKQNEAIKACIDWANDTCDAIIFERFFELNSSSVGAMLNGSDEEHESELKHDIKVVRKELARRHKTSPSPQVDFALAKNLLFFGKKEKHNELSRQILSDLANRPLSATLSEYQLQGEPTITKPISIRC